MSTTYIALLISGLSTVAARFGFTVDVPVVNENIMTIISVIAWAYAFYGRYKAGGITVFGFRKI